MKQGIIVVVTKEDGTHKVFRDGECIMDGWSACPKTPEQWYKTIKGMQEMGEHLKEVWNANESEPAHAPQPVGEWVTEEELMAAIAGFGMDEFDKATESLNALLTDKFGPRTYNGEPASEWGLEEDDFVLWWHVLNYWTTCRYSGLAKGDQWMMQLPAPKGGSDED